MLRTCAGQPSVLGRLHEDSAAGEEDGGHIAVQIVVCSPAAEDLGVCRRAFRQIHHHERGRAVLWVLRCAGAGNVRVDRAAYCRDRIP